MQKNLTRAGHFTIVSKQPFSGFKAEFAGSAGQIYLIQATTNLVDWVTLDAVDALDNGTVKFEDAESDKLSARFYRVISRQPAAAYDTRARTH